MEEDLGLLKELVASSGIVGHLALVAQNFIFCSEDFFAFWVFVKKELLRIFKDFELRVANGVWRLAEHNKDHATDDGQKGQKIFGNDSKDLIHLTNVPQFAFKENKRAGF